MIRKLILIVSLLIINSQNIAFSGTISFDQLAISSDLTVASYNSTLDKIYREFNTNTESSNIAADTVAESDMADDANPRIRTAEGASCEFVYTGLLTTTTVGTLTGTVPAGTAYPLGYRIRKDSATSKTFTASKWTYVDLDINGNFIYSEVAIDAATPSVAANSVRLSRVSTDGTQIFAVQDLRTTSCVASSFDVIRDAANEANLDDIFRYGKDRISADTGWVQGNRISWDGLTTTFSVLPGSAYVNGNFRRNTSNTSVPQTADAPLTGTSGLDTGAIAASTNYTIYAVADQSSVATMSFSFSASPTAPTGVTNYRKIGQIKTDGSSNFVSQDMLTFHTVNPFEIVAGAVKFDGSTTPLQIGAQMNVSSLTDNGTGNYTVTWDTDMQSGNYITTCSSNRTAADQSKVQACQSNSAVSASTNVRVAAPSTDAAGDGAEVNVIMIGDKKQ